MVPRHAFAEQVAAAEYALAVDAAEAGAVVQKLHGARLVLRDALPLVAAACRPNTSGRADA
jgi:hypothetical protein